MDSNLKLVKAALLDPTGLSSQDLQGVFSKVLAAKISFADLYFEHTTSESFALEDGAVKDAGFAIDKGVGLRVISEGKTGFAYSDSIEQGTLLNAADAAKSIAKGNVNSKVNKIKIASSENVKSKIILQDLYSANNPLDTITTLDKKKVLETLDVYARSLDPRVKKVNISLSGSWQMVLVVNTEGLYVPDVRPLVRLNISVIVESNGRKESGYFGGGGRVSYSDLLNDNWHFNAAEKAVRQGLLNLEARPAPAGMFPVILGNGWAGVLLHEAIGHGLEGDFNRKKTSAFSDKMGKQVASKLCTIVDDGTIPLKRGSLQIDDEGVVSQKNVLIEKGILKGYMQDRLNADLMGMKVTGNGRRESYAHLPMPRMTNTYMLPGDSTKEEIIASVKKGIYAVNFDGGQVDITSGQFVFGASEAYYIENGKIQYPIKGATLIGNGPEVLKKVTMVGNDLELDTGVGTCGKDGQSVPVGVGQPTLKIDSLTVGGTKDDKN